MANTTSALADWVLGRCESWRAHKEGNYIEDWDRYERLWRGLWDGADSTRDTERSKIVTPMLQQAIETFSPRLMKPSLVVVRSSLTLLTMTKSLLMLN